MIAKTILIRDDQNNFIGEQSKDFSFSKFVRSKLDDYIEGRRVR